MNTKKILFLLATIVLTSFKADTPKTLKVELTIEQWNAVLEVVEKSNAPHLQVKGVQQLLMPQLQKQVADSTKK